jgi:hypothetical protein
VKPGVAAISTVDIGLWRCNRKLLGFPRKLNLPQIGMEDGQAHLTSANTFESFAAELQQEREAEEFAQTIFFNQE